MARTKTAHEHHCSSLLGEAANFTSTTYGVTRNSILNKLQYFHITSGLPPDIMHDIFEGVAVVELHCMLSTFIQTEKLFSLTLLNNRILNFPFGITDSKNKPLPLPHTYLTKSSTEALKQSCKSILVSYYTSMYVYAKTFEGKIFLGFLQFLHELSIVL